MQTTFYPMDFVTQRSATKLLMAENIPEGMVRYLETLGLKQAGWRDEIVARPLSGDERAFFALSDKVQVAIFEFRRTGHDENGIPIRFTVTVYPADRNQFQMEAGRVPPGLRHVPNLPRFVRHVTDGTESPCWWTRA